MPRYKRLIYHNALIEVTFRTEEGLPFVASTYMKRIITSIMATAQTKYPTTICDFILMANHMHMLLIVQNPEDFVDFIAYIKRESAHAVNRLLGIRKHTIWCERYDDPKVLDYEKVIERKVYYYTNPQTAGLVNTIEEYPNLSSWQAFITGGAEIHANRIKRHAIKPLSRNNLSIVQQESFANELYKSSAEPVTLYIEPDAWMDCFEELEGIDADLINDKIINQIRKEENRLIKHRSDNKIPVLGANALKQASMRVHYFPKKHGKRMICLSSVKKYRQAFIHFYKLYTGYVSVAFQGRNKKQATRDYNIKNWLSAIPSGLFSPGRRTNSSINPAFIPVVGYSIELA